MRNKKVDDFLNKNLEKSFHMNSRIDEAIEKANIQKEEQVSMSKKRFCFSIARACAITGAIVAVASGALTYIISSNNNMYEDLEYKQSAMNYFSSNEIEITDNDFMITYHINDSYLLNIYSNDIDYYYQVYKEKKETKKLYLSLEFNNGNKSKMIDVGYDPANEIAKINDEDFVINKNNFSCTIYVDNVVSSTYYIKLK